MMNADAMGILLARDASQRRCQTSLRGRRTFGSPHSGNVSRMLAPRFAALLGAAVLLAVPGAAPTTAKKPHPPAAHGNPSHGPGHGHAYGRGGFDRIVVIYEE